MKNYSWEYFNVQINQKLSERKAKPSTVKEKLMWSLFWNYEAYFEFHSKVRSRINKDKRELGLVLMILNIRKVPAQRAENYKKS